MKLGLLLTASLAMAQSPVFRADTRAVEVTVVATHADGSPVTDLRKDELRVFDKGREQSIASFDRTGSIAENARATRAPQRTIIVLDGLNTYCGDQIYGREAVARVLTSVAPGTERIAIFSLADTLQLLHDFSTDPDSLRDAVGEEADRPLFGVDLDDPKSYPCDVYREHPPPPEFRQTERLTRTLDALKTIARRMKTVQGEKSLLWVTGGFPPPADYKDMDSVMAELADARVRLFPVDARGIPAARSSQANLQTMQELAEPTGGRVYGYDNDTTALVQAALDDSKAGYLLTFSPREYREDGSLHELRLKTSRKGVELRYRPSYIASPEGR